MFNRIFVEENCLQSPQLQLLKEKFKSVEVKTIDRVENYFGRVKKPYLQKRDGLNLYVGEKRGELIKLAPPAYGLSGEAHYYYVHAYNCLYECEYCYLQGHFDSPDLVWFINHDQVIEAMKTKLNEGPTHKIWFHAGEFSDSLALSHLTGELPLYHHFFENHPRALWELRTKSVNIKEVLKLKPLPNMFVSFSLSPQIESKEIDLLTPSTIHRLKAMKELVEKGFQIAIHFDPIIHSDDFLQKYQELISLMAEHFPLSQVAYLSLGVVRFTKDVYHQVQKNYPESRMHAQEFIKGNDGKVRYPRPMRLWMLQKVKELCLNHGMSKEQIYLCME